MKNISPLSSNRYSSIYRLKLGTVYRLTTQWERCYICRFIKTTGKGFNMLCVSSSRCRFGRTLYQEHSSQKKIGLRQQVFEMNIPKDIERIQELEDGDFSSVMKDEFEKIKPTPIKPKSKPKPKPTLIKINNALDGMEI